MEYYKAMSSIIESATDASAQPNRQTYTEVAELIKSRSDMPKEAVRNFMARFQKKTKQIVLLTIELIEFCVYTCELNFYTALDNKDFLLKISALLSSQSSDQEVKDRVLELLYVFSTKFKRDIHTNFFSFFNRVQQKGFPIPSHYQSKYSGATVGTANPSKYQASKPATTSSYSNGNSGGGFENFGNKPSGGSSGAGRVADPGPVPQKYEMAKRDLMRLKEKILKANHLIDNHNPNQSIESNSELSSLMKTLCKMDTELQNLIAQVIDCEIMCNFSLPLNDDLNSTIERYKILKTGGKPPGFGGEEVEPEILRQIEEMELNEKRQKEQQKSSNNNNQFKTAFDDFGDSKPQQQQQSQPKQQPQQQQENLLDLMDDGPQPPVQNNNNNNNNQVNNQTNNNNAGADLFDLMDTAPQPQPQQQQQQNQFQNNNNNNVNNQFNQQQQQQQQQPVQQQQQNQNGGLNVQNLYGQQQQQQPQQQDKYSIFDQMQPQQQQFNPMMQNQQQQQQQQQFNNMNNNNMNQQQNMMYSQQQNQNNFNNNNNMMNNMNMTVNPSNNNMNNNFNNNMSVQPNRPQQQQFQPQQQQSFQPINNNNNNNQQSFMPQGFSANQNQQQQKKQAFDGLDDMFGLGGPKPAPPQNNNSNGQQQSQPQQSNGGGFDLL